MIGTVIILFIVLLIVLKFCKKILKLVLAFAVMAGIIYFISISDELNAVIKNTGNNVNGADIIEKTNISMKVKEDTVTNKGLVITITNNTDELYYYGPDYIIENLNNDEWKEVETEYPLSWNDIAYNLNASDSIDVTLDWSYSYKELLPGKYRVVKRFFKDSDTPITEDKVEKIYAEFEI